MQIRKVLTVLATVLLMTGTAGASEVCGDIDNNGTVQIQDVLGLIEQLSKVPDPGFNEANADVDGITGVTIGDAAALGQWFFSGGSLNCNTSGSYSFLPAEDDTIFVPSLTGVSDGTDQVNLLVFASFSQPADGYYLPFLQTTGGNGLFELNSVQRSHDLTTIFDSPGGDTAVLMGFVMIPNNDILEGRMNLALLQYGRVAAGNGDIAPQAVDRGGNWQIAIARGGELYRPTIVYYEAEDVSGRAFTIDNHDFTFFAESGQPSADIFQANFTSNTGSFPVVMIPSETWIGIDDYVHGTLPWPTVFTPVLVTLTSDASGLGATVYEAKIEVYYDGLLQVPIDTITVTMSVTAPPSEPGVGDMNCDGSVDVLDILHLVSFLFLGGPEPGPCP